MSLNLPTNYNEFLKDLKIQIRSAQSKASLAVNQQMIQLYHNIGLQILSRQSHEKWGSKIIDHLAADLKDAFPDLKGFSKGNLKYMRFFAEKCPHLKIGQQPADQLPWFHIVTILTKVETPEQQEWYAVQTAQESWSRLTLEKNIQNKLIERHGKAVNNFEKIIPQSANAAGQILKDPYIFDFLNLTNEANEAQIENSLVKHITQFLLELGSGFAFVNQQYRLNVNGDDFFIDLLFYHIKLKCYVVIELKNEEFKPAHIGQLNFYLSTIDAQIKSPTDEPTIGILLCREKNHLVAQYALNGVQKPIGIAEYQLVKNLPEKLAQQLPSVEELEIQLDETLGNKKND